MEAKELRIGNLIKFDGDDKNDYLILTVLGFYSESDNCSLWVKFKDDSNDLNIIDCSLDNIKPILLTEKWLLNFGFKKYSEGNFVLGHFILSYLTTDENLEFEYKVSGIDSWLLKDIKYVHQLQNLYFELIGEELIIKRYEN